MGTLTWNQAVSDYEKRKSSDSGRMGTLTWNRAVSDYERRKSSDSGRGGGLTWQQASDEYDRYDSDGYRRLGQERIVQRREEFARQKDRSLGVGLSDYRRPKATSDAPVRRQGIAVDMARQYTGGLADYRQTPLLHGGSGAQKKSLTAAQQRQEIEALQRQIEETEYDWTDYTQREAMADLQRQLDEKQVALRLTERKEAIAAYDSNRDDPAFQEYVDKGKNGTYSRKEDPLGYYLENRDMLELQSAYSGAPDSNLRMLKEKEQEIYYYLLGSQGSKAAKKYLDDMQILLDQRVHDETQTNIKNAYQNAGLAGKAGLNAMSVPAQVFGGITAPIGDVAGVLSGRGYNPYNRGHMAQDFASQVRGLTEQDIIASLESDEVKSMRAEYEQLKQKSIKAVFGGLELSDEEYRQMTAREFELREALKKVEEPFWGRLAANTYQAVMSGADSALGAMLFRNGYTSIMSAGTASQRARELWEAGASDAQIGMGAMASGLIEMATEKYSVEYFTKYFLEGNIAGPKDWMIKMLIQGVNEDCEEMASEVANMAADAMILGGNSDNQREIRALMAAEGLSREEAEKRAFVNRALDILWAGYGGFVSGGAMGGVGGGINWVASNNAYKSTYGDFSAELVQEGLESPEGSESHTLAQKYKKKLDSGKKLSGSELRKLVQVNDAQKHDTENDAVQEDDAVKYSSRDSHGNALSERQKSIITVSEIQTIQNIGRKSVNSFTTSDLKAAERFAKTYWNEMDVKSPFFRAWFGDWRANDQSPVQIANRPGDARGIQHNDDTGWDIQVSGKVFAESQHFAKRNTAAIPYLRYINDIVKKAVLLDSWGVETGRAKSHNSLLMHSMYAVADIGNGPELLKLYIEEMNNPNSENTSKRAYQLQNIEKASAVNGGVQRNSSSSLTNTANVSIKSVADLFAAVKRHDPNFNPGQESVVVNTDGTPRVMYAAAAANRDFYVFDGSEAVKKGGYGFKTLGKGNYFTARKLGGTAQYGVYLNIRKPYVYEGGADFLHHAASRLGLDAQGLDYDTLQRKMRARGYDGVLQYDENGALSLAVAFDSSQIKSATENIGTFDGSNPDIRFHDRQYRSDRDAVSDAQEDKPFQLSPVPGKTLLNREDGSRVVTYIIGLASNEKGNLMLNVTGQSEPVRADRLSYASMDEAVLYQSINSMDLMPAAAQEFVNQARSYSDSFGDGSGEFSSWVMQMYILGESGVPLSRALGSGYGGNLNEAMKKFGYYLGRRVYDNKVRKAEAQKKVIAASQRAGAAQSGKKVNGVQYDGVAATRGRDGSVEIDGVTLNDQQKTGIAAAEMLASMGVNVHVFQSRTDANGKPIGEHGSYSLRDGSIHIDLNAGNDGQGIMAYTVAHEFTHFMEQQSPAMFQRFTDCLFEALDADVGSWIIAKAENLCRQRPDIYRNAGWEKLLEDARSEVTAEACETMLTDTDAAARIGQRLQQQNKSLFDKIRQWFRELAGKLRQAYKGLNPDSQIARDAKKTIRQVDDLVQLWADMAVDAAQNYRTAPKNEKSTADEGGVKYMARTDDKEGLGIKEQIRNAKDILNKMEPVVSVSVKDLSGMNQNQKYKWATETLKTSGFKVDRQGFGVITFSEKQINTGMNYLHSEGEVEALAALPRVLKRGRIIYEKSNHKRRNFGTATIAAPVSINGQIGYMGVVVQMTSDNHYHTHRILMPDGSSFVFE